MVKKVQFGNIIEYCKTICEYIKRCVKRFDDIRSWLGCRAGKFLLVVSVMLILSAVLMSGIMYILAVKYPLPKLGFDGKFAVAVVSDNGSLLRTFADDNGVWRYPVKSSEVSPLYLEALINYEDRYFYDHPGVNPWAIGRVLIQYVKHGRFVSGGSTITMQVARLFEPYSKSIGGKFKQMFRAIQLERRFSKDEILTLYLNFAPFGGAIEGVQAASLVYLGKPAKELSHAEAALLAVLPQAPSRLRPDRHPERAQAARNKILNRLLKYGIWDDKTVHEAMMEGVAVQQFSRPLTAPLLARRLKHLAKPGQPLQTSINIGLQQTIERMLSTYIESTPEKTSAAVLVVENSSLLVKAYIGSADFTNDDRFGHVDMVTAIRSPGSALKPFLYAVALEEGLVHSESLLVDAPYSFSGYRPGNFTRHFAGPVSVSEALQRSLNLPAVDLLDRLVPAFFHTRMRQGGFRLNLPLQAEPNLSIILGGVGISLEDLTAAFAALGRDGIAGKLRYSPDDPLIERHFLDPGAAYIIRKILTELRRPDLPGGALYLSGSREVAWKTGTSYGARDAWCIGVTEDHTLGVWVGRPDGTPSPGFYGRATAAPLLFRIVDSLPRKIQRYTESPTNVTRKDICWPLGLAPSSDNDPHCHQRRKAWILNDVIPPTLPDRFDLSWQPNPMQIMINPLTGLRVEADCPADKTDFLSIARWPKASWLWLAPRIREASRIPALDPLCGRPAPQYSETVRILGLEHNMILRPPGSQTELPTITLQASGGSGKLYWLMDGELIRETEPTGAALYRFTRTGRQRLTVMDIAGNFDSLEVVVVAPAQVSYR